MRQRQVVVTEKNISLIPTDILIGRLKSLRRSFDSSKAKESGTYLERLESEIVIIRDYLVRSNKDHLLAEKLMILGVDEPAKEEYAPVIEMKLRELFRLMNRDAELLAEIKELEQRNKQNQVELIFPVRGSAAHVQRPKELLEQRILDHKTELEELEWQIDDMKRALSTLDPLEFDLIESKFFCLRELRDYDVMEIINTKKDKYYKVKVSAYLKLARYFKLVDL